MIRDSVDVRLTLLRAAVIFLVFWARPIIAADSSPSVDNLVRADSWLLLARATGQDAVAYQQAARLYDDEARRSAEEGAAPDSSRHGRAVRGAQEAAGALGNFSQSFRNFYKGAWWISGADSTAEFVRDPWTRAAQNAARDLLPRLGELQVGRVPALIRVGSSSQAIASGRDLPYPAAAIESQLRAIDAVISATAASEGLWVPAPLDGWDAIGNTEGLHLGEMQPTGVVKKLAGQLGGSSHIAFVDVILADHFKEALDGEGTLMGPAAGVFRVDAVATVVEVGTGDVVASAVGIGLARELHSRNWMGIVWWCGCGAMGLALFLASPGANPRRAAAIASPHSRWLRSLFGGIAFIGGGLVSALAFEVSGSYLPAWDAPAVGLNGFLQPEVLLWPLVHGGVVMLGPLIALGWLSARIQRGRFSNIDGTGGEWHALALAPAAQMGASARVFTELVVAEPGAWLQTAVPIALVSGMAAWVGSRAGIELLQGRAFDLRRATGLVIPAIVSAVAFPVGLHGPWGWGVAALAFGAFAWVDSLRDAVSTGSSDESVKKGAVLKEMSGRIYEPLWVPVVDLSPLRSALETQRNVLIYGPERAGTSRVAHELREQMRKDGWKVLPVELSARDDDESEQPFEAITRIFDALGVRHRISSISARSLGAFELSKYFDDVLTNLPGAATLLGMIDESDNPTERHWVIEDCAKLIERELRALVTQQSGHLVRKGCIVTIDKCDRLDDGSKEVFWRAMDLTNGLPIGWAWVGSTALTEPVTREFGPKRRGVGRSPWSGAERFGIRTELSEAEVTKLGEACGLREAPSWLFRVLRNYGQGKAGRVFDLLHLLYREELLVLLGDGQLALSADFTEDRLIEVFNGGEEFARERIRINRMGDFRARLLSVAALCGSDFSIAELTAGTGYSAQQVADELEAMERCSSWGEIELVDLHIGEYRFRSEFTRGALEAAWERSASISGETNHFREASPRARILHAAIASAATGTGPKVSARKRLFHAVKAGAFGQLAGPGALVERVNELEALCAWQEIIALLDTHMKLRKLLPEDEALRVDRVEVRARREHGAIESIDRAARLLVKAIRSLGRYPANERAVALLALDLGDVRWSSRTNGSIEFLSAEIKELKGLISERVALGVFAFYEELIRQSKLASSGMDPLPYRALRLQLEQEPPSPARDELLSRLLLNEARAASYSDVAMVRVNWAEVKSLFVRAGAIKANLRDYAGLAMVLGTEAGILGWVLKRWSDAEALFREDLALCKRHRLSGDLVVVKNKLSVAILEGLHQQWSAQACEGKELSLPDSEAKRLKEARLLALEAAELAFSWSRYEDYMFAMAQLVAVSNLAEFWGEVGIREGDSCVQTLLTGLQQSLFGVEDSPAKKALCVALEQVHAPTKWAAEARSLLTPKLSS